MKKTLLFLFTIFLIGCGSVSQSNLYSPTVALTATQSSFVAFSTQEAPSPTASSTPNAEQPAQASQTVTPTATQTPITSTESNSVSTPTTPVDIDSIPEPILSGDVLRSDFGGFQIGLFEEYEVIEGPGNAFFGVFPIDEAQASVGFGFRIFGGSTENLGGAQRDGLEDILNNENPAGFETVFREPIDIQGISGFLVEYAPITFGDSATTTVQIALLSDEQWLIINTYSHPEYWETRGNTTLQSLLETLILFSPSDA